MYRAPGRNVTEVIEIGELKVRGAPASTLMQLEPADGTTADTTRVIKRDDPPDLVGVQVVGKKHARANFLPLEPLLVRKINDPVKDSLLTGAVSAIEFGKGLLLIDFGKREVDAYRIEDGQLKFQTTRSHNLDWYALTPEDILQHLVLRTPVAIWLQARLRLVAVKEIREELYGEVTEEQNYLMPKNLKCPPPTTT